MRTIFSKVLSVILLLIFLTVVLAIVLNSMFLQKFYYMQRYTSIRKVAVKVVKNDFDKQSIEMAKNKDLSIHVFHLEKTSFYKFATNKYNKTSPLVAKQVSRNLKINKDAFMKQRIDGILYIVYFKKLEKKGNYLIIRSSLNQINQAIQIANTFFIYSGIFILLLGLLVSFLLSKKLTDPIRKINRVIGKLAQLDFSEKLKIKTNDELAMLGSNINFLSVELEKNIQNLKIANLKLKSDISKEKELENMKSEFLSNVSHEIKTPITIINTYAESLRDGIIANEKVQTEYAEIIIDEGLKISKQIDDLIKYMNSDNLDLVLEFREFNIVESIIKARKKYKLDLKNRKIKFVLKAFQNKVIVFSDEFRIDQVINNFFSNAISHTKDGGEIDVNVLTKGQKVIIEVINTGELINEKYLEKIWTPLFKTEQSRNSKYGGMGLGLAIVKNILEKNGSDFGVSNMGNRVKFWFDLTLSEHDTIFKTKKENKKHIH